MNGLMMLLNIPMSHLKSVSITSSKLLLNRLSRQLLPVNQSVRLTMP